MALRIARAIIASYFWVMEAYGDYYATLRVAADVDAVSLRRAYRELMRRYHPDVTVDADAEERCRAINEAYACLSDPDKRQSYDLRRRAAQRRHRQATYAPPPPRPTGPVFTVRFDEEEPAQARWKKVLAVALGLAATLATFTATAAVDWSPTPAAAAQGREIVMKVQPGSLPPAQR